MHFPIHFTRCAHEYPVTLMAANFSSHAKCDFLDGKHVVFGKIIDGLLVMRKIEDMPTGPNNRPKLPVVDTSAGKCSASFPGLYTCILGMKSVYFTCNVCLSLNIVYSIPFHHLIIPLQLNVSLGHSKLHVCLGGFQ